MKVDLEALQALDAVIRHGGYAQAAAQLNKVSSALSYQIRKLEDQLHLPLLDRSGYRVRLTPEGEAVLAEGRRLLQQAGRIETLAEQLGSGWEARLLVSSTASCRWPTPCRRSSAWPTRARRPACS